MLYLIFLVIFIHSTSAQIKSETTNHYVPVCMPATGDQLQETIRGPKGEKGERGIGGVNPPWNPLEMLEGPTGSIGECFGSCDNRHHIRYHFPRRNQTSDYVQYRSFFPRMSEATACMWVEIANFGEPSYLVSYAAPPQSDNEFAISIMGSNKIQLFVANGNPRRFKTKRLSLNKPNHICAWFSTKTDELGISVNGDVMTKRYRGRSIRGGGSLIFGQDQDAINAGRLDAQESFSGTITNFMLWPRVLSSIVIGNSAINCVRPEKDYVIILSLDRTEMHGETSYSIPEPCPVW